MCPDGCCRWLCRFRKRAAEPFSPVACLSDHLLVQLSAELMRAKTVSASPTALPTQSTGHQITSPLHFRSRSPPTVGITVISHLFWPPSIFSTGTQLRIIVGFTRRAHFRWESRNPNQSIYSRSNLLQFQIQGFPSPAFSSQSKHPSLPMSFTFNWHKNPALLPVIIWWENGCFRRGPSPKNLNPQSQKQDQLSQIILCRKWKLSCNHKIRCIT